MFRDFFKWGDGVDWDPLDAIIPVFTIVGGTTLIGILSTIELMSAIPAS